MSNQRGTSIGHYAGKLPGLIRFIVLLLFFLFITLLHSCGEVPIAPKGDNSPTASRNARLNLWLAKKSELIEHESAAFDLVVTAWFKPGESVEPARL